MKNRWIHVSERLPEPDMPVLIIREPRGGEPMTIEIGWRKPRGEWKIYGTASKAVVYWMPLPKVPEAEA